MATKQELKQRIDAIKDLQGVKAHLGESMPNPKKHLYDYIDDNDEATGDIEVTRWEAEIIVILEEKSDDDFDRNNTLVIAEKIKDFSDIQSHLQTLKSKEVNHNEKSFEDELKEHLKDIRQEQRIDPVTIIKEKETQVHIIDKSINQLIENTEVHIIDESTTQLIENSEVNVIDNTETIINVIENSEVNTIDNTEVNIIDNTEVNVIDNTEVNVIDNTETNIIDNTETNTIYIEKDVGISEEKIQSLINESLFEVHNSLFDPSEALGLLDNLSNKVNHQKDLLLYLCYMLDIDSTEVGTVSDITDQGSNVSRYEFDSLPEDLSKFRIDDEITVTGMQNAANDGTFLIVDINVTGNGYIEIINESLVVETGSTGSLTINGKHYNQLIKIC
jgi:hypothetical protein